MTKTVEQAVEDLLGDGNNSYVPHQLNQDDTLHYSATLEVYNWWIADYIKCGDYEYICTRAEFDAVAAKWKAEQGKEWDGEGLPPINSNCVFEWQEEGAWVDGEVVAHRDGCAVIYCAQYLCSFVKPPHMIRKPKSERDKAIEEMMTITSIAKPIPEDVAESHAGALYDAGYRKQMSRDEAEGILISLDQEGELSVNRILQALGFDD